MPYMNVDQSTGFIEFTRTPEEVDRIESKEKINKLEETVDSLTKLVEKLIKEKEGEINVKKD